MVYIARTLIGALRKPKELWTPQEKEAYSIIAGIEMTPEERRAQAISFAYGNVGIENPNLTRQDVERAHGRLYSN